VLPVRPVQDLSPAVMQGFGARSTRATGVIAIHDDWARHVLIFCQISEFEYYNANKKSNKSI